MRRKEDFLEILFYDRIKPGRSQKCLGTKWKVPKYYTSFVG